MCTVLLPPGVKPITVNKIFQCEGQQGLFPEKKWPWHKADNEPQLMPLLRMSGEIPPSFMLSWHAQSVHARRHGEIIGAGHV